MNERRKAQFAHTLCHLKSLFFQAAHVARCGGAHLKTPHISRALGEISSTRENLGRISRYFLLLFVQPILDGAFKWRTSWHVTTAALHRNYILLSACSFTCVFYCLCLQCMNQTWATHQLIRPLAGRREESFVPVWLFTWALCEISGLKKGTEKRLILLKVDLSPSRAVQLKNVTQKCFISVNIDNYQSFKWPIWH